MDGRVEVFPDQSVVLHIPVQEKGHHGSRLFGENCENYKLYETRKQEGMACMFINN